MKVKILGMALLALAATSAFAATNASGTIAGHFTHEGLTDNVVITAHDGAKTLHSLEFTRLKANSHETAEPGGITCETSEYTGKVEATTVQTIQLFPIYKECYTTGDSPGSVAVHPNGCSYTFHSQGAFKHGTVTVDCPPGKAIEITHSSCVIKVPAQTTAGTLTEGISYDKDPLDAKALTATVTVKTITGHFESGLCVFLGTAHKFEMIGSVTVKGYNWVSGTIPHNLVHGNVQIPIAST